MALYIKTDDYRKYGISKSSTPEQVRAVVQRELNIHPLFVRFVNRHEFIRVDFLKPRGRRSRGRGKEASKQGGRRQRFK
ncbi:hypothetical protein [Desulfosoma caldarium]|uniref:Uncharacterized protein n=1 Tax=Desulfosoma caldarium TaxID=610254 RepID=A0A3N1UR53_9BACT|nr:hypothetical protein [Desulfosoma caldarium]ROQ93602.1 hypothetical protein EDC27_1633 [Desulfosoma caldarium]